MTKTDLEQPPCSTASGSFVNIHGEDFYQILHYDQMAPFLMSIVSPHDHWMYVSSTGGLTAGRVRAENCLFPYQTVDQLHDSCLHTGPVTFVRYRDASSNVAIWQPFSVSIRSRSNPSGPRRLLKHLAGNQLIFEEKHESLGLVFRYSWRTSGRFGFVRTATLENISEEEIEVEILDGLQNICPSGVALATYQQASCLVDAYKHNEIDPSTGMAIYSLTSQIVDRAEAVEALQVTTAWSRGLPNCTVSLSAGAPKAFAEGFDPAPESLCTGCRGNFFSFSTIRLLPGQSSSWYLVADVGRSHPAVAQIRKQLLEDAAICDVLEESVHADHHELLQNVASADGLQATASPLASAHHFANVLFNNMRGGISAANYWVESRDFREFIDSRNRSLAEGERTFLRALPDRITYVNLLAQVDAQNNTDLVRLAYEYLPLTFGRRHGDPSRPWNSFEVKVRKDDGSKIYNYQGNWRDIFQNWEAMGLSFPVYLPSFVAKFVNASTIDGFNPYRITRGGIDWEVPDAEDAWSNIGYWGDHQIVYLTKLLEAMNSYFPGELESFLDDPMFCYADVPYRIKSYEEIVADSCNTIDYDELSAQKIDRRMDEIGSDGKLVPDSEGNIYHANLIEKLMVPVLAKLSNFAIDGGIWLNTQRPEWNDANNALVGAGLSMVTVCYLRRHLNMIDNVLKERMDRRFSISTEVEQWFRSVRNVLHENRSLLKNAAISDDDRGRILGRLGRAFSDYRFKVYDDGFSGKHTIAGTDLVQFVRLAVEYIDHSIRANCREDGLYHAYNLLEFSEDGGGASVSHLYEMLEGQVAVLSSGAVEVGQAEELMNAVFASKLYREDQRSFMLYPDRNLPGFLERNQISNDRVNSVELLRNLLDAANESIVVRDVLGVCHFHHAIQRQADLEEALNILALDQRWAKQVTRDRPRVLQVFEEVFHHKSYTGRSGTMYGYEGLGCIYWHMVSKLLLATQENVFRALDEGAPSAIAEALADSYFLVRGGLSSDKTPAEYGAFPTDPYSHTPKHGGASQPGMTGQVKEEIITRRGELGVRVCGGQVRFQPFLVRRREFFQEPAEFAYFDLQGDEKRLELSPGSLAFTFCQTPVVYRLTDSAMSIHVAFSDGASVTLDQDFLDEGLSLQLFQRTGKIVMIEVNIPDQRVLFA